MKVALYARVSKEDTDCVKKKDCPRYSKVCDSYFEMPVKERCPDFVMVQNPENQLFRLRNYAKEQGFEVYKEYVDRASGADPNRKYMVEMLKDARGHRFASILVVRFDRIARSMINFHDMLKLLNQAKVKFRCVDQPEISTDTPSGELVMGIFGYIAQYERALIIDRTKAALERLKAEGKTLGRPNTVIDMERVRELKAQGWGIRRIAKELKIAPETLRRGLRNEGGKTTKEKPKERGG